MIAPPRNTLVSFYYYGPDGHNYDLDKLASTRIIGDCGAYSAMMQGAEVSTKDLLTWGHRWRHRLAWIASLDVHGNPQATRDNWQEMLDGGLEGVPTIHMAEPTWREDMDWFAERGVDFMGLGGVAGSGVMVDIPLRFLVQVFKYARDNHPQMRFHGWGYTRPTFTRLPFFSVDSSGWGAAYRYGRLALRHPHTGQRVSVRFNGKDVYRPDVALLLRDHYGVNPSQVATTGPHNRLLTVELAAKSAAVQEQVWRRQFRNTPVSRPRWGQLGGAHTEDGPHQHLAEGYPEHLEAIAALAEGRSLWADKQKAAAT